MTVSPGPTLDLFDMTGRNCIVTGGAGLLGQVFADALADAGADVFLFDVSAERLDPVCAALQAKHGKRIHAVACDITDPVAAKASVGKVSAAGGIHALVNSAAIDPKFEPGDDGSYADNGAFPTYSLENWTRSLSVNLSGSFIMTQAVCSQMERIGAGAVVNIASTYGLTGPDQRIYERADGGPRFFKPVDYSATKAGILGFTRAVAAYYRETRIRVNALVPGGADNNHDPAFAAAYGARTIMGRMADAREYRGPILFLCSEASSYMTGAALVVDGGWTAL
jgi:NAD(P)-dependent dehydrogenase (short-subunit alcohol dehydrogenase family)